MNRPLLDRAESLAEPAHGRYCYRYALSGSRGELLVQWVRVELRYFCAEKMLVHYRASYAEFFRLGVTPSYDIHGFDPRRDGWTRRFVRWLLHHQVGRPTWRDRAGPSRIEYCKRFVIGPGASEIRSCFDSALTSPAEGVGEDGGVHERRGLAGAGDPRAPLRDARGRVRRRWGGYMPTSLVCTRVGRSTAGVLASQPE